MKERPILFSAPMVRAILDGLKTQTRRVVKPQPDFISPENTPRITKAPGLHPYIPCPYGLPGDRLWVRETWMDLLCTGIERSTGDHSRYAYRADTPAGSYGDEARKDYGLKWRPSIHMPRAATRILLDITAVRVERLQDISEADAVAEGVERTVTGDGWRHHSSPDWEQVGLPPMATARQSFFALWNQINGAGSWTENPWVWVVEFKRVQGGAA